MPTHNSPRHRDSLPHKPERSREDDPQLEEQMQRYHRAKHAQQSQGDDGAVKKEEGAIGRDMAKKTDKHARGRPATS